MVQLWVNLPAREKLSAPRYQEILDQNIPRASLEQDAGTVRVIAGQWGSVKGPARTVTPLCVFDLRLNAGHAIIAPALDGHTAILLVQHGRLTLNGRSLAAGELAILERAFQNAQSRRLLDAGVALADEAYVGFVDEGRRLQGMSGPFAAQVDLREPVQLGLDQRDQAV